MVFDAESDKIFIHSGNNSNINSIVIPANTVFDVEGNGNPEIELIEMQEQKVSFESLKIPFHTDKYDNRYYQTVGKYFTVKNDGGVKFDVIIDGKTFENNISECLVPVDEGIHNVQIVILNAGKFEFNYEGREERELTYAENVKLKFGEGAKTVFQGMASAVIPASFLAIPVIGPLMSAFSAVLTPFYAAGAFFVGLF